jgi:hypothetical protein
MVGDGPVDPSNPSSNALVGEVVGGSVSHTASRSDGAQ